MTIKEAIESLNMIFHDSTDEEYWQTEEFAEAVRVAIEALSDGMTKQELLKKFEHLHGWGIECEEYCGFCDYLQICDTIEQLLERKMEEENEGQD